MSGSKPPRRVSGSRARGALLLLPLAVALAGVPGGTVWGAGVPQYMRLDLAPGLPLEIKGTWDGRQGVFVASDLEELPKPRSPKLRGAIEAIDPETRVVTLFGVEIQVSEGTKFPLPGGGTATFEDLKRGQRVEVSCWVDPEGLWTAHKIKTKEIKHSNKIKAVLTGAVVDGVPPDTLEIHGLIVLVVRGTDVNLSTNGLNPRENELFGDLYRENAYGMRYGTPMMDGAINLEGEYRQDFVTETDFDLSGQFASDLRSTQPEVRLAMTVFLSHGLRAFGQARLRKTYLISSQLDRTADSLQAYFIQLFILAKDIGGTGLALQAGRQDYDEPREWLYDEYLDAVRAYFYASRRFVLEGSVIHSVNPIKAKFRTWTDLHLLARWYPNPDNQVSAYVLKRYDTDLLRNREPLWLGLRYYGRIKRRIRPWAELALMRGEDKGETLDAWGLDVGATLLARELPLAPYVILGYAFGTGDDTSADTVDHGFRQTGYEDNFDRFGGVTAYKYYGILIDPELSNLEILTLGAGFRPTHRSSLDLVYHRYRQDWVDNRLRGSNLVDPPARPNAVSPDIGSALDLIIGFPRLWNVFQLSWKIGLFYPGEAFAPRTETALFNKVNLRIRF